MKLSENFKDLLRLTTMEIPGTNGVKAEGNPIYAGKEVLAEIVWNDGCVEYQNHIFDNDGILFYVGERDYEEDEIEELLEEGDNPFVPSSELTIIKDSANPSITHIVVTECGYDGQWFGTQKSYQDGKIVHEELAYIDFEEDGMHKKHVYVRDCEFDDNGNEIAARRITGPDGQGYYTINTFDEKNRETGSELTIRTESGKESTFIYKRVYDEFEDGSYTETVTLGGTVTAIMYYDKHGNCVKEDLRGDITESEFNEYDGKWYLTKTKTTSVEGEVISDVYTERNEYGFITRIVSTEVNDGVKAYQETDYVLNETGDVLGWKYADGTFATVNYIIKDFVDEDVTLLN